MKDIKDYRQREQSLYIIANVMVFLVVHNIIDVKPGEFADTAKLLSELFNSVIFSAIAYGFIFVVECLFTSSLKEKLLYVFGVFHLSGCSIFSNIKKNNRDKRFSYATLMAKHQEIYDNMPDAPNEKLRYENEQWYLIYSQIREVSMIQSSQRDALMCRDIYISTLTLLALYFIVVLIKLVCFNWKYLLFIIIMLSITNIGANRKASRFAYNVIAYDVSHNYKEDNK